MSKKIFEKLASAGTVALLGYEVGTHINEGSDDKINQVDQVNQKEEHNSVIVISGIGLLVVMAIAICIRLFMVKRPLV